MQFAVIDIEATGGYAAKNGIMEIAVIITDGFNILDSFYSMINPGIPIPRFIESLTGITNDKVKDLPAFSSVAEEIFALISDKIFVAHNVNFDYSFVKYHLKECGFELETKKLCTIRLGRHVVPGLKGYGLDKICRHLKININGRHSAFGDATATVELLHHFIQVDGMTQINKMLAAGSGEMSLPPNVNQESVSLLPQKPGVYYFHEKNGKIIYVGKAGNIRKRVRGHFTNNKPNRQKQEFLKRIYRISYEETATELMALVLEGIEIKRRWPKQNKSLKKQEQSYGLYSYTDSNGFTRLFIEKKLKYVQPFYTFAYLAEGYSLLRKLIRQYELCPYLCFLTRQQPDCHLDDYYCKGACRSSESPADYNKRVAICINELSGSLPSFAVVDKGLKEGEKSCILVEKGKFVGMGYIPTDDTIQLEKIRSAVTLYNDDHYVRSMIVKYAESHPYQTVSF